MDKTRRTFLKLGGLVTASLLTQPVIKANEEKLNFIIIFTDDQGYQDLGCFGSPDIKTPNIDRMADEGRIFTDFYVGGCVCSPSRAALLTGCYPKRVGMHKGVIFPKDKKGLHPDEITIAELMKSTGYETACIGKWHLGHAPKLLPTKQGFDYYFGLPYSNDMKATFHIPIAKDAKLGEGITKENIGNLPKEVRAKNKELLGVLVRNTEIIEYPINQRLLTKRYTEESMNFIKNNKDKPFFLYLPHSMPHLPVYASDDFAGKSANGPYGDTIEEIDWSTGKILDLLRELNIDHKTIVVFTSDNGPWLYRAANKPQGKKIVGSALPLRHGKQTTWEGGPRVPCVMWAPGRIPAGTKCTELLTAMDFYPTFGHLAGARMPMNSVIDGKNVWELMTGDESVKSPYESLLYYSRRGVLEGIRKGDWKLLIHDPGEIQWHKKFNVQYDPIELFNLKEDISEANNLVEKYPDKVKSLKAEMHRIDKEITAQTRPIWTGK